jgi:predicted nucleic acid-binding protein
MSKQRLLDTNMIVRYLVQDDPRNAAIANHLFEACDRGVLALIVLPEVVAESVFVLESFYKHPRAKIAQVMSALVTSPGIELTDVTIHLDALHRFALTSVHYVDCTVAATAAAGNLPVASFDRDFKKFADVVVNVDPAQ